MRAIEDIFDYAYQRTEAEPETAPDWVNINPKAFGSDLKAKWIKFRDSRMAFLEVIEKAEKRIGDEDARRKFRKQIRADLDEELDSRGMVKFAKSQWQKLKDEAGFDLRGVFRRRALVPFVLFPREVAARHSDSETLSIYQSLRQAHEAFVFGTPLAALSLMRSIMETVLRDHYGGVVGDGLTLAERIRKSRKLLPDEANEAALHRLRKTANAILHLDAEKEELLPKITPENLEEEILSLLRVLRALIEGAPKRKAVYPGPGG